MAEKKRVLFVCTGNSARSQMAEGLLRHDGGNGFEVDSAGTHPAAVRPEAMKVMDEIGIDISGQFPKYVDKFVGQPFDYVITVCDSANEACPVFPSNTNRLHWSFEDPAKAQGSDEARLAVFRNIRDQIRRHIAEFLSVGYTAKRTD